MVPISCHICYLYPLLGSDQRLGSSENERKEFFAEGRAHLRSRSTQLDLLRRNDRRYDTQIRVVGALFFEDEPLAISNWTCRTDNGFWIVGNFQAFCVEFLSARKRASKQLW